MTVHICVEPSYQTTTGWFKVAEAKDTLKFPGVDSCLAMAFLMSSGAMVGTHTGVFGYGDSFGDLMGNDCSTKMLKAMLKRLTVYDGRISKFIMFTDIGQGGGDQFFFDLDQLTNMVRMGRAEDIAMCKFNKTTGPIDIEMNGPASLLTIKRAKRTVLTKNFSKITAGTHDIPL